MNKYIILLLETLTNTHVGSGNIHYSIVDNLVQRDHVTQIPVIHSSSLKGAIREYYCKQPGIKKDSIIKLFGDNIKDDENDGKLVSSPGRLIFFEANLLTLPLRASTRWFYHCTSPNVIREYIFNIKNYVSSLFDYNIVINWLDRLNFNDNQVFYHFTKEAGNCEIEDYSSSLTVTYTDTEAAEIKKLLGIDISDLAIFSDMYFRYICENSLPVIARNKLDDGESENLFYEEVLPRRTRMYFVLGEEDNLLEKEFLPFVRYIIDENRMLQFGGNYSIGYGFSKLHLPEYLKDLYE